MKNLFLFTGENFQALNEKLKFWENEFVKKHDESNLEKFEGVRDGDLAKIINAIETQPFLADKRMVIVKGLPYAADAAGKVETDSLEDALEDIAETSLVIFVSPKPDKRSRFYKLLAKEAVIEEFPVLSGDELEIWVQRRLKSMGKTIQPKALDLLILYTAGDGNRLAVELEKLALIDSEQITEADVEKFISPTPEAKIFKSLDLIGKGSPELLLRSFNSLVRSGESLMLIFFMIVRQMRLLIQVRSLLDRSQSRGVIQKRLKLAPFQVNMLVQQAGCFKYDKLKSSYVRLAEIDYQIKTGGIPSSAGSEELLQLKLDQFLCSLYE